MTEPGLEGLLEQMADGRPGPSAGSAAGLAVAMAAALVGKAARLSHRHRADHDALATSADDLRGQALVLADTDARDVRAMLTGTGPGKDDDGGADPSAVPRRIAVLGQQVAELAASLAQSGNPALWADARTAEHLARAAVAGVDAIVRSNDQRQR